MYIYDGEDAHGQIYIIEMYFVVQVIMLEEILKVVTLCIERYFVVQVIIISIIKTST